MAGPLSSGRLILVVGPSGVGKDMLLDGARRQLASDPQFVFVRREITRPQDAGGERHISISVETFLERREAGEYALSWGAHQLYYGIPNTIKSLFPKGVSAVVNGSRSVIDEMRQNFDNCSIISIRANIETLRQRLLTRGRETEQQIDQRLQRADAFDVKGSDVIEVWNDGSPEEGITKFTHALLKASSAKVM
ncbi:MAG: phosphonate metabolism protein/1,5-bisphosphokinase (PRPP-forming) PhnN [Pseudomonadota bacterium]